MSDPTSLILALVLLAVIALAVYLAAGHLLKANWGINLRRVSCPRCHALMPGVRKPSSTQQALWGGWTCEECGCEMDKWGREISR